MLNSNNRLNLLTQLDESMDVPDAFPDQITQVLHAIHKVRQNMQKSNHLLEEANDYFLEAISTYDRYVCLLENENIKLKKASRQNDSTSSSR